MPDTNDARITTKHASAIAMTASELLSTLFIGPGERIE
jgi:hypothetical protein